MDWEFVIGHFDGHIREQWTDLFKRCSWYDFTFINFMVERNYPRETAHHIDIHLALMGVCFYLCYRTTPLSKQENRRDQTA